MPVIAEQYKGTPKFPKFKVGSFVTLSHGTTAGVFRVDAINWPTYSVSQVSGDKFEPTGLRYKFMEKNLKLHEVTVSVPTKPSPEPQPAPEVEAPKE